MKAVLIACALVLTFAGEALASLQLYHTTDYVQDVGQIDLHSQRDGRVEVIIDRNLCLADECGSTCTFGPVEVLLVSPDKISEEEGTSMYLLTSMMKLSVEVNARTRSRSMAVLLAEAEDGFITGWKKLPLYMK